MSSPRQYMRPWTSKPWATDRLCAINLCRLSKLYLTSQHPPACRSRIIRMPSSPRKNRAFIMNPLSFLLALSHCFLLLSASPLPPSSLSPRSRYCANIPNQLAGSYVALPPPPQPPTLSISNPTPASPPNAASTPAPPPTPTARADTPKPTSS